MATLAPQRVEEVAAAWRLGIDLAEGLENPAGPRYDGDVYALHEIVATGGNTWATIGTATFSNSTACCVCCRGDELI
jgi:hypothetical protein